ncbi:MAG TPA: hypothetical protein VHZ74_13795 [Bryobacteraceae bacterium]|jgi:hypothetical protein|nr:hypothetical protein [Bryobacteraceae bacterium]
MNFDRFRERVMSDPALMEQFLKCDSEAELFAEALTAGHKYGFTFDEKDLSAIANLNRRQWLERWTQQ